MFPTRKPKSSTKSGSPRDLNFEIIFFEGITKRDPQYVEALQLLGDAYTKSGQWDKGLLVDLRLAKLCPENSLVFYNLACSHALLKEIDAAFDALSKAIELGYNDERWMMKDPDLKNLRTDKRYDEIKAAISHQHEKKSSS